MPLDKGSQDSIKEDLKVILSLLISFREKARKIKVKRDTLEQNSDIEKSQSDEDNTIGLKF